MTQRSKNYFAFQREPSRYPPGVLQRWRTVPRVGFETGTTPSFSEPFLTAPGTVWGGLLVTTPDRIGEFSVALKSNPCTNTLRLATESTENMQYRGPRISSIAVQLRVSWALDGPLNALFQLSEECSVQAEDLSIVIKEISAGPTTILGNSSGLMWNSNVFFAGLALDLPKSGYYEILAQ
eukprot:gene3055-3605_t